MMTMVYLLFKLVIMEVIAGSVLGVVVAGTVVVGVCAICRSRCTQCFFVFCFVVVVVVVFKFVRVPRQLHP